LITELDIDNTAERVLIHKLKMGLFDSRTFLYENTASRVLDEAVDSSPLFYFGYGLSYSRFHFESMTIQESYPSGNKLWDVHVKAPNFVRRDADEVFQVYVQNPIGVFPHVPF
jgi:hypothetical protein